MSKLSAEQRALEFVKPQSGLMKMSRRRLLKRGAALGGSFLVGSGFVAASGATWALEVKALEPATMATLVQMARDIYPHDRFGDDLYAAAVKGHDEQAAEDEDFKIMLEAGVVSLDAAAKARGQAGYLQTGWESDRVEILKSIEEGEFFQTIRGGLVVGLYNQEAVWNKLGYEGSSFEKGGYLNRGFDDINWV